MGENRIEGARVKLTAQDTSTNKTDNTATGADTLQVHCDNILIAAGGDSGKAGICWNNKWFKQFCSVTTETLPPYFCKIKITLRDLSQLCDVIIIFT